MRTLACLIFSFFIWQLPAQEVILTPLAGEFTSPGVVNQSPGKGIYFNYFFRPNVTLKSGEGNGKDVSSQVQVNDRVEYKVKVPVILKDNFKFLLGLNWMREEYEFKNIRQDPFNIFTSINDQELRTCRISSYFLKSINERMYATLKLEATFNGDYDGFINTDERYAIYRGAVMVGIKPRPDKEYGFGLLYSRGFRGNRWYPLPFGLYNQTFSDKWGIQTVLPVNIKVRYNFKPGQMVLVGPEFRNRVYSIDVKENVSQPPNVFNMRASEIQGSAEFLQRISWWFWLQARVGYAYSFDTTFDRQSIPVMEDVSTANPSGGMIFQVGVFLSPPRDDD